MEQFWRQIRIQRAKIHKTSLVRSPAQGTFFFVGLCYLNSNKKIFVMYGLDGSREFFTKTFLRNVYHFSYRFFLFIRQKYWQISLSFSLAKWQQSDVLSHSALFAAQTSFLSSSNAGAKILERGRLVSGINPTLSRLSYPRNNLRHSRFSWTHPWPMRARFVERRFYRCNWRWVARVRF